MHRDLPYRYNSFFWYCFLIKGRKVQVPEYFPRHMIIVYTFSINALLHYIRRYVQQNM